MLKYFDKKCKLNVFFPGGYSLQKDQHVSIQEEYKDNAVSYTILRVQMFWEQYRHWVSLDKLDGFCS